MLVWGNFCLRLFSDYNLDIFTSPFWEGNSVYYETICFTDFSDGKDKEKFTANLIFNPDRIIAVRSTDMKTTYAESKDYTVNGKTLVRTENSALPYLRFDEYATTDEQGWDLPLLSNPEYRCNMSNCGYKKQVTVYYTHSDKWDGIVPKKQTDYLPRTLKKLKNGDELKIVFFGDSISTGCDTSGGVEITVGNGNYSEYGTGTVDWLSANTALREPHMPAWPEMVKQKLERVYKNEKIIKINKSSCSSAACAASKAVDETVSCERPDLVVIAFGMNGCNESESNYKGYINEIITRIKSKNENSEFLLLSAMVPNLGLKEFVNNRLGAYEKALYEIQAQSDGGIGVVPINGIFSAINACGKKFFDYSFNNINHPSDFGVTVYAQAVLSALGTVRRI